MTDIIIAPLRNVPAGDLLWGAMTLVVLSTCCTVEDEAAPCLPRFPLFRVLFLSAPYFPIFLFLSISSKSQHGDVPPCLSSACSFSSVKWTHPLLTLSLQLSSSLNRECLKQI